MVLTMLMVGPVNGLHRPPSGSDVQSALRQQLVEHFRALVELVGTRGAQMPLSQSEGRVQVAPCARLPCVVGGARQTLAVTPWVVSRS
jgi:hypothetical protein